VTKSTNSGSTCFFVPKVRVSIREARAAACRIASLFQASAADLKRYRFARSTFALRIRNTVAPASI
jgi:hypothetical protein